SPLQFFAGAACGGAAVGTVTILAGSNAVTFSASAWTGTSYTVAVNSGTLTGATQAFTVRPLVRSGVCVLDASTTNKVCGIPAPFQVSTTNTALFYQATSSSGSLSASATRCDLTAVSSIACHRNLGG